VRTKSSAGRTALPISNVAIRSHRAPARRHRGPGVTLTRDQGRAKIPIGCGWLNNTDRGGTVGVIALLVGPEFKPLGLSGAEPAAANGFGNGGDGGRNDCAAGHPDVGGAPGVAGVSAEAAGPPADNGPLPNREVGPGSVSNGNGKSPYGIDGSRENKPPRLSIDDKLTNGLVGSSGGAAGEENGPSGADSDAAHPGAGEAPGMPGIGADAAGPPAEKSPPPNGEAGPGSDRNEYGNSPWGIDGSCENRPPRLSIDPGAAGAADCPSDANGDCGSGQAGAIVRSVLELESAGGTG
jgi:hypothetical protein